MTVYYAEVLDFNDLQTSRQNNFKQLLCLKILKHNKFIYCYFCHITLTYFHNNLKENRKKSVKFGIKLSIRRTLDDFLTICLDIY